jgi:hypothetical protein
LSRQVEWLSQPLASVLQALAWQNERVVRYGRGDQVAVRSRLASRSRRRRLARRRRTLPEHPLTYLARDSPWRGAIQTFTRCAALAIRYNFAAPLPFFAIFKRRVVQHFWHASTPSPRPADRITANAPLDASTRPRRERTNESKRAEQMDARYARGRTALVRRRERFYGLKPSAGAFLCFVS